MFGSAVLDNFPERTLMECCNSDGLDKFMCERINLINLIGF